MCDRGKRNKEWMCDGGRKGRNGEGVMGEGTVRACNEGREGMERVCD